MEELAGPASGTRSRRARRRPRGGWPGSRSRPGRTRLEASGFVEIEVWTTEEPTPIEPGEPLETYLRTVCLRGHLEGVPAEERDALVARVAALLPRAEIAYVRLNIRARRGPW